MRNILVDAGPLIALFDKSDQYHLKSLRFMKGFHGYLSTTWPVISEVSHMLDFSVKAQLSFLEWINRGGLQVVDLSDQHLFRMTALTEKFSDVPMDLADASLVAIAETLKILEIATIDSDFYVYRDVRNNWGDLDPKSQD